MLPAHSLKSNDALFKMNELTNDNAQMLHKSSESSQRFNTCSTYDPAVFLYPTQ